MQKKLNDALNAMSGIIGHGLFYKKATGVIVAGKDKIDIYEK